MLFSDMQSEVTSPTERSVALAPANSLTRATFASFVLIGIANIVLGPLLPTLSARWSLNYAQAGGLFTAQYIASMLAVAFSGMIVSWRGFRFAMQTGIGLIAAGSALLLVGPLWLGIAALAASGAGLGIAIAPGNLLIAELNPERRAAALNRLNFFWSTGAVSCPFLVAASVKLHRVSLFLAILAGLLVLVGLGIRLLPAPFPESAPAPNGEKLWSLIRRRLGPFVILAILFFVYVGTENSFGGWVASFAKSLGKLSPALAVITPSFFYASLMLGRWLAPFLLESLTPVRLVNAGLLLACAGAAGLLASHGLAGVILSACATGLGLSSVYPITISVLSEEFGSGAPRVAAVMFVLSNLGGASLPWVVGIASNGSGTLKTGLLVPLFGCGLMFILYIAGWSRVQTKRG